MTAMSLVLIFVVVQLIVLVFDVPRRHFVEDKSVRVVQIRVRLRVARERSRSTLSSDEYVVVLHVVSFALLDEILFVVVLLVVIEHGLAVGAISFSSSKRF
jgi:hypothetical protein